MMKSFLRTHQTKIVDSRNQPVVLRGVNLGGWLMMEGYIMHSLNIAEQVFKRNFNKHLGAQELKRFERDFRENFVQEADIRRIADWGFNCLRVPFNSRLVEVSPYEYSPDGVKYLDRVVAWGKKYGLWIILDLHAACGAQNHDWHSDSLGRAELWHKKELRKRTIALWDYLADHFKDEPAVAGYDVLNEAVTDDIALLNVFYRDVIKAIRRNDRNHILFVEGNRWAQDLDVLEDFQDDNLALSIHFYEPLEFTFNFVPHLRYPLSSRQGRWNKDVARKRLSGYERISRRRAVPILVGEFGVNAREGVYGEERWVEDVVACFEEFGFHWTYWTYKAMKNSTFPDGLLNYLPNPPWVNRSGPQLGWDRYHHFWKERRREMISSWRTENFTENAPIVKVLQNVVR